LELGEDPAREPHVVTTYFFVDQQGQLSCEAKRETIDLTNRLTVCMKPTSGCATPTAQPIISNVERLVVKYGVDFDINADGTPHVQSTTDAVGNLVPILDGDGNPAPCLDGSANYYVDADNVSDWTRVVSAQLYVVLRSEDDNLTQAPATYRIDDTTYTATDKRYYRVFSTTVAFRNQLNNQPEEDRLLCL
jgi:hypothetical protein